MQATLTPKTKKARERIKEHGATGRVLQVRDRVAFSSQRGPWLLVEAADLDSRWVHATHDPNFNVTTEAES